MISGKHIYAQLIFKLPNSPPSWVATSGQQLITQERAMIHQLLGFWDDNRKGFRLGGQLLVFCPEDITLILGALLNGKSMDFRKTNPSVLRTTYFQHSRVRE